MFYGPSEICMSPQQVLNSIMTCFTWLEHGGHVFPWL